MAESASLLLARLLDVLYSTTSLHSLWCALHFLLSCQPYAVIYAYRISERCSLKTIQKKLSRYLFSQVIACISVESLLCVLSQALGLLVPVSSIHYWTSTPGLSTMSSTWGLTRLLYERPHLKAGFTLRCFQRLSVPNVATQLYPWRDNWYTIGSSTPVLSY